MFVITALAVVFLIWFAFLAETAPTLDYMADDR
jgi:hypothetical protein